MKQKTVKRIFVDTIEKYKSRIAYWLPTSHFYVDKDIESILQTLELYYIVSKFNVGSSRKPGIKVSYYGLNYGLCLENTIDYGKPELRRTYDYWRQNEFDYSDFIPEVINKIEVPICRKCGYRYTDKSECKVAKKFGYCLQCRATDSIEEVNNVAESNAEKITSWRKQSMPDIEMDILRVLYNNRGIKLSAVEIGSEIEKHHLAVTKVMGKLIQKGYVSYEIKEKRYYSIEETAIEKFFDNEIS